MIDTVRIAVQYNERPVWYDHVRKEPKYGVGGLFTAPIHPIFALKTYKLEGIYVPRLQYIERPATQTHVKTYELNIELSLPKLYFGNNFSELTDIHFSKITNILAEEILTIYGISLSTIEIEQAIVGRIDYSKNTIFTDRTPVSTIISTLETAAVSKVYDLQDTRHRNGGETYHLHTNTIDIVLYDKVADLRKSKISEKRSHEKDNYTQLNLINEFDKHPNVSIARWEIRLNGRPKIRRELKKIGVDTDLQFNYLFSSDISRKVMLRHWEKVTSSIPAIAPKSKTATQILKSYKQTDPDMKFSRASALTLMQLLHTEEHSERKVRNIIERLFGTAQYRYLKNITFVPLNQSEYNDLQRITNSLTEMKPVSIAEFIQ